MNTKTKETAVEWLIKKLRDDIFNGAPLDRWEEVRDTIRQAKLIEREQIMEIGRAHV